ncbi:hypothetical protein ACA081_00255 [Candidatus Hodgkinia cicadicola]
MQSNPLSGLWRNVSREFAHLDRWSLGANAPDLDVCPNRSLKQQSFGILPSVKIVELARLFAPLHACPLGVYWLDRLGMSIIFNSIGESSKYA